MDRTQPRAGTDTVAFASLLSGAYASAAVALLFLVVDALRGDPFFTPALMGSVVLLGSTPSADLPVRLDMVAYYSLIHGVVFALLGTALTLASLRFSGLVRRAPLFTGIAFALLTLGIVGLDGLLFPGLVDTIGLLPLVAANLGAAAVMTAFIRSTLTSTDAVGIVGRAIAAVHPAG